jgi:flagellar biosynthesis protein FlhF
MKPQFAKELLARAARVMRRPARARTELESAASSAPAALSEPHDQRRAAQRPRARPPVRAGAPLQIHRVRGRDLVDALERAARSYGEHALVLSREPAPGGGITVAVGVAIDARPSAEPAPEVRDHGCADLERRLKLAGASDALVERAVAAARRNGARGPFALDAAAVELGGLIAAAPSPRVRPHGSVGAPHVLAFVGPTGVGKTTTLVKLASRLVRAQRRVALVSLDGRSLAGRAQLEAYARLLQAPVVQVDDGRKLARSVAQSRHVDAVLVDTAGESPRCTEALQRLGSELAQARGGGQEAAELEIYLTLSATSARGALDETLLGFGAAGPTALVLTKLDETRQPAQALEFAHASRLPVAFLCDGSDVGAHLHRTSPDRVADLFLRGRMG